MNSNQRVHAAISGQIPDKVPIGEYAVDFDTIEKIIGHETYLRAKAKSQIAFWQGRHEEVAQSYLEDQIELQEKLELDIINLSADATWYIPPGTDDKPPEKIDDSTWEDKYGRVFKYSDATADIVCVHDPVAQARTFSIADYDKEPTAPEINKLSQKILNTVIGKFKNEKFICGPCGGEIGIVLLGSMQRGCIELIQNPDTVKAATAFLLLQQNLADKLIIHPDSDAVLWGIDFGYNTGPLISPAMFKEFFLEANKQRAENLHGKYGKIIVKHCCGNNKELLDYFIEIGYDVYQSIQLAAGMDICEIKKSHGDKITLWGGVAVENIISGTAQQVRDDVKRAMACAKDGGRFILGTSHSIAVGSNYDNFMAMLDEHQKLCDY